MKSIEYPNPGKWWIAYNEDYSIVHYGRVDETKIVTSGQPYLDTYDTEKEWEKILNTLGIDPYNDEDDEEDDEPEDIDIEYREGE